MKKNILQTSALMLLGLLLCAAHAADTIEPAGIYTNIDDHLSLETIKALRESKGEKQMKVADAIIAKPGAFSPPVLYVLASVLFEQGKKDDAVFWLQAAQLRGRIDANICADKSAAKIIYALNGRYGLPLSQYCSTNLSIFTNMAERVVAWEENTPCNYDRRWINLHGMDAFNGNTNAPLSAPLDQWDAIRKRTRDEYAAEFHKKMDELIRQSH